MVMTYNMEIKKQYRIRAKTRNEAIRRMEQQFLNECNRVEKIEDLFQIKTKKIEAWERMGKTYKMEIRNTPIGEVE